MMSGPWMGRLVRRLRKQPVRRRLQRNFVLMSLLSIIAVGFVCALFTYRSMERKAVAYSRGITGQVVGSVSYYLENCTQRLEQAAGDLQVLEDVRSYDGAGFPQQEDIENRLRLTFASIFEPDQSIDTVELVTPGNTRFYFNTPISDGRPDSRLLKGAERETRWFVSQKETALDTDTYIILSRSLSDSSTGAAGSLLLSLRRDYLDEACRNSAVTDSSYVIIADRDGRIISHPDSDRIGGALQEAVLGQVRGKEDIFRIGGELYAYGSLPANGWLVLNVLSYPALMRDTVHLIAVIGGICGILVLISLFVSFQVTRSVSEPVDRLVKGMRGGHQSEPVPATGARDECEDLVGGFNRMIRRIASLIEDDYHAEVKNRELELTRSEAELSSLQQQINPHFLYNTLETIYWSGQMEGNEAVSQMITALGNYFRSIINKGREYIPVHQEIENVGNYLFLQNKRFSDRISLAWDVEEPCRELYLVKLTFQPIIEDIISYSVERTDTPVEISIRIGKAGDSLVASVSGKNVGLLLGTDQEDCWSGVRNVHERLKLYFGDPFGVTKEAGQEGCLEVTLPLLFQKPEGN